MGNGSVMTGQQGIGTIRAVLTGKAVPYTRPGSRSAIAKSVRTAPVRLGPDGLEGDEQETFEFTAALTRRFIAMHGPTIGRGGANSPLWIARAARRLRRKPQRRRASGRTSASATAGAWGRRCSSSARGASPAGSSTIASMPGHGASRAGQPAHRLVHAGDRPGLIEQGDAIALLERPFPDWTVARLFALIRDRVRDPAQLSEVLGLPLPDSWRRLFRARLESGAVESWARRLDGAR